MEEFKYKGKIIRYTLERKKIKNSYISVKDANITVKVPTRTSDKKIEELIEKRAEWIIENVEKQKKNINIPKNYIDGEKFLILGKEVILNILYEKIKCAKIKLRFNKLFVILPVDCKENNSQKIVQELIDKFYTQLAEKEVEKAMRKMTMKVGIAPNNYKIKNLKSTWGNCSISSNISINKKVVMYSRHTIEYVCLHELCHLKNMNHSKEFWNMVKYYMPDYKMAEEELKS